MSRFEHYMYVLECVDGSLYTGYTTDVAARVAKHNTGKGSKCTASRRPVNLLASARFFTKQRAMSAEARFKRLTRDQKDALLAQAAKQPFEEVLERNLPGFGPEPIADYVARTFAENQEDDYKAFMESSLPSVDPKTIVGVPTPVLQKMAKAMVERPDAQDFLKAAPHILFEEDQIHGFMMEELRDSCGDQAASEGRSIA